MYHERFRGSHYEIGWKWGAQLFKCGKFLLDHVPFPISQERLVFAEQCRPFYEKWYPEMIGKANHLHILKDVSIYY